MDGALKLWVVIIAVGLLNYASRLSFIAFFARRTMPPALARALKFVPAAMLTALVMPMIVAPSAAGDIAGVNPQGAGRGAGGRGRLLHAQHAEDARRRHGRAVAVAGAGAGLRFHRTTSRTRRRLPAS